MNATTTWAPDLRWALEVLDGAALSRACEVFGDTDVHRLDITVDDAPCVSIDVGSMLAVPCAVEVAASLVERSGSGACSSWSVRVVVSDEDGDLLVREWTSAG